MNMDGEHKKSGWSIWLYMTPVYIVLGVMLFKWVAKLNSGDVQLSNDEYGAFNAAEGEVKKIEHKAYDPGLSDIGYTVRYRSGKGGEGAIEQDEEEADADARAAAADTKKRQAAQGQGRPVSANQAALNSSDTNNKAQMGFGNQKGYLTYAVGKAMNNPKAVGAMFNNSWVVKGFMGRDTVKGALGSQQGLQNYLSNPKNVSNFLNNPVVQAAMNNQAVVNTFASSGMASAILASPAVQGLLQNPDSLSSMMSTNPEVMQALTNPNVLNALMNNPQTAGLAAGLAGGGQVKR
ncbi:MAG: hypothetical protein A2X35_03715 [Elusimicrobia bacterium GWA2_61_42]|nr:MAG: hypothetical protein A2X35_03715 [Elusimicrobia bacterium GWA2_61_42]OGR77687.1 MAG: hypothetical protein A2X38_09955 [Elusimicrobia bacterium GWC2_61_25]